MNRIGKSIILLFIFGQTSVNAQSDMVMLRPIDFSPGMIGNKGNAISLSSHNMNLSSLFQSYNASLTYEFLSKKLKGGIGISYSSSFFSIKDPLIIPLFGGNTSSQRLNVVYAPKFVLKRKLQLSPFVKLSGIHVDYAIQRLVLDHDVQRMQLQYGEKHNILATSLGLLINKQKWFIGMETYGLNTLLSDSIPLSKSIGFKYQAGMFFKFTKDHKYGVSVILSQAFNNELLTVNNSLFATFKLNQISLLLSHHHGHGILFNLARSNRIGLGYQPTEKIKIAYSINIGSKNANVNNYNLNHQVGFQYIIKKKREGFF